MHPTEGKIFGIKEVYRPADREAEIDFGSLTGVEPSGNRIHHHAQTLVAQLYADRKALSYSYSRSSDKIAHLHTIFTCTYGILFFGTPHHGSSKASLLLTLQKLTSLVLPRKFGRMERGLVKALEEESETLQNITDYFTPLMKDFHIHFFWEQEKTDLKYTKDYIVEKESAAPTFDDTERSGISADHSGMVKFEDSASSGFRLVAATLDRYCAEASEVINQRRGNLKLALTEHGRDDGTEKRDKIAALATYMPLLSSDSGAPPPKD
ncbi:hypothetical protein CHU98_g4861 [Xylaria longipes]|nr:hypothetical protein CHU98_g4861 [Xylaria longipes]